MVRRFGDFYLVFLPALFFLTTMTQHYETITKLVVSGFPFLPSFDAE